MTYWKLVNMSIYPVAIQLVFCKWFRSLPIFAYDAAMMVPSIAARNIPIDIGITYPTRLNMSRKKPEAWRARTTWIGEVFGVSSAREIQYERTRRLAGQH